MILGWDVSTSAIGVCLRDGSGSTVEFGVIYPQGETQHLKQISAARQVDEFCRRVCRTFRVEPSSLRHFVEDRLGGFTGGKTTRQTLMALAAMNAVISFVLSGHGTVTHIPPVSAKRIVGLVVPKGGDKKVEVIRLVRSREASFPYAETAAGNYARGIDDMADAWLNAEVGLRLITGEATLGQSGKAKGGGAKAGSRQTGRSQEGGTRVPVPRKTRRKAVLERPAGEGAPLGQS